LRPPASDIGREHSTGYNRALEGARVAIVVQKYGGSSVADVERMHLVADRVAALRRTGTNVVVVVSAMGDTTDDLLALARKISENPARRELDMLLTAGERMSMALLSMALNERGVPAVSFTGSQSGIITNDAHTSARIVEVRPYRIQDELARGRVVIVAGYQGVSYRKEITTLGRGGSDTTAVALAAALDAEACEIYSDVAGIFTADPRVVSAARRLSEISYEEMQELAEHGAKVLNAQAVEFAKDRGIAIYARATSGEAGETVVRKFPPRGPGRVVGIASESGLVLLSSRDERPEALLELFDELEAGGKEFLYRAGPPAQTSLVLSLENLPDFARLKARIHERFGAAVALREGVGAVSAIGAGINASYRNLRTALVVAAGMDACVLGVSTSSFRVSLLLDEIHLPEAVQKLHARLVG
jgi:aspartate kinase